MLETMLPERVNGLYLGALGELVDEIGLDAGKAMAGFQVKTRWAGGTRSESTVESFSLGGETIKRSHKIVADEPHELLGSDGAPNPQELLMSAVNACMMVGYVAGASLKGIELESVEIETSGELDLRGFLGLDDAIPAGYQSVDYIVRIKGDASVAEFEEIHRTVMATSPNYFNMSRPVRMNGTLSVI